MVRRIVMVCFLLGFGTWMDTSSAMGQDSIDVNFLVKDLRTGTESELRHSFDYETLRKFKMTENEIKSSWIEIEEDGNQTVVSPNGRRIGIYLERRNVVKTNILKIEVSPDQNINLTMKDILNDPELVPVKVTPLVWKKPENCNLRTIRITPYSNFTINSQKVELIDDEGEGLMLTSINPENCAVAYQKLFYTNNFGVYRDLISVINSLIPGRIIVIFSQSEGAYLLHPAARQVLSEAGSVLVNHYLYGDAWVWIFVKDGQTLGEALIPNLGNKDHYTTSPSFEVNLTLINKMKSHSTQDCPNWPQNDRWQARRAFCQVNDAILNVCDCKKPFQFALKKRATKKTSRQYIPILIICGSRLRSVISLLESLAAQKDLNKSVITLVLDGDSQTVRKLAYILGLRVIVHSPVGHRSIRVSRNLRFGLFNGLKMFPESEAFIILEDDLIVSPDFYSYMRQLKPIFKKDSSVYAISGFNFLSSPKTSVDPTLTYRTDGHPAYGWMMSRENLEELVPKWPHKAYFHDWDHLLAANMFRKGRQIIIPDVNRVYHNCVQANGVHVNPSWYGERQFLRKGINNLTDVVLQPYDRLLKQNYEEEMRRLVKMATVINVVNPYHITLPESQAGVYIIYAKMINETDYEAFKVIGDSLETWIGSPMFHMNNHTWRLFYNGYPLLVVGVPFSYYTRYMPPSAAVFSWHPSATEDLLDDDVEKEKIPVVTHRNFYRNDWKSISIKELDKSSMSKNNNPYALDNFSDLLNILT